MSNNSDGSIAKGSFAGLAILRAAFLSTSNEDTAEQALAQHLNSNESLLHPPLRVKSQQSTEQDSYYGSQGRLVITSERILYWCDTESDGTTADLVVPSECIDLHALSSSMDDENDQAALTVTNLYLQLQSDRDRSDPDFIEWTLVPICDSSEATTAALHALFEALSKLISLHPIDPNLEMDDGGDSDDMVFAPSLVETEATSDERGAMLDHLDSILVVPPDLQHPSDGVEGQFDDADEGSSDDADDDEVDAML